MLTIPPIYLFMVVTGGWLICISMWLHWYPAVDPCHRFAAEPLCPCSGTEVGQVTTNIKPFLCQKKCWFSKRNELIENSSQSEQNRRNEIGHYPNQRMQYKILPEAIHGIPRLDGKLGHHSGFSALRSKIPTAFTFVIPSILDRTGTIVVLTFVSWRLFNLRFLRPFQWRLICIKALTFSHCQILISGIDPHLLDMITSSKPLGSPNWTMPIFRFIRGQNCLVDLLRNKILLFEMTIIIPNHPKLICCLGACKN